VAVRKPQKRIVKRAERFKGVQGVVGFVKKGGLSAFRGESSSLIGRDETGWGGLVRESSLVGEQPGKVSISDGLGSGAQTKRSLVVCVVVVTVVTGKRILILEI